jgi:cbb3-type cytochrome oxidase maturation protein
MEALYLLVPLSIAIVFAAIWLFFRMSDGGQFDDLVSPGWRILQDDDKASPSSGATEIPLKDDATSN